MLVMQAYIYGMIRSLEAETGYRAFNGQVEDISA
jgi:hypothetical protein